MERPHCMYFTEINRGEPTVEGETVKVSDAASV